MFEFSKSLSSSVSISGGGWGYDFSASSGYKKSISQMSTGESIFIISTAKCIYYFSKFLAVTPPDFSDAFLIWVHRLNNSDEKKDYYAFFDEYGTHFPTYVVFGSSFTFQYKMSSTTFRSQVKKGIDIALQASYSSLYSAGGGFSMDSSQQEVASAFSKSVETTVIAKGAAPPANSDAMTWASDVKENPVPMKYELQPIVKLFSEGYMKGLDVDFSAIANNMKNFQFSYCNYLKSLGQVYSCVHVYPGIILDHTLTLGYPYISKKISVVDDCFDLCVEQTICVAASICSYCTVDRICFLFNKSANFIVSKGIDLPNYKDDWNWTSVVFSEKIDYSLRFRDTAVIGISQSSKAIQSISKQIECHNECIKYAFCVAYTFCQCPSLSVHCELYGADTIIHLHPYVGKSTYFVPLRKKDIHDGNTATLSQETTTNG